jgi:hypothetical protein
MSSLRGLKPAQHKIPHFQFPWTNMATVVVVQDNVQSAQLHDIELLPGS